MAFRIPKGYKRPRVGIEIPDSGNYVKLPDNFSLKMGCLFECDCHYELQKIKEEANMLYNFPYDKEKYEKTRKEMIDYLIPKLTNNEINFTTEQICFLLEQFDEYSKFVNKIPVTWSAQKLREGYAQPETVRAAELREQSEIDPGTDKYLLSLSESDRALAIEYYKDPKNTSLSRLPSGASLPYACYCPDCKCKRVTTRCACMCGNCYTCDYRWQCYY